MANILEKVFSSKKNNSNISKSDRDGILNDPSQILGVNKYNAWQVISKLRNINDNFKYRYSEYDVMEEDVLVQSALELYADDSTQLDTNIKHIVKVESKDSQLQEDLTDFLNNIVKVDSRIWQWAYDIAKYGDFYLKVHTPELDKVESDEFLDDINDGDDENRSNNLREVLGNIDKKYEESDSNYFKLEEVEDPSNIMDLWYKGERVAYATEIVRGDENNAGYSSSGNASVVDLELRDKCSYIHFFNKQSSKTDKVEIPIQGEYVVSQQGGSSRNKVKRFSVVRGYSMIEGVRSIYRIIQLLENSLLAARIAKAEFVRVYNIEVGDDTPGRTAETVNRVKNLFDAKASYDTVTGRYKANKEYKPIGDPVFNPIRNGKGSVTHEDIGGDFEVKNLVDMDYFLNRFFAGLKIPKAYLGFEESLPGGLGDSTLVRLDIRYSRSVKRVQVALANGIKDICLAWLDTVDRDVDPNNFDIILVAPSSSEELSRLSELDMRINTIDRIASSIQNSVGDYVNMPKILCLLYENYLGYPELKDDLIKELKLGIKNYDTKIQAEQDALNNANGADDYDEE